MGHTLLGCSALVELRRWNTKGKNQDINRGETFIMLIFKCCNLVHFCRLHRQFYNK